MAGPLSSTVWPPTPISDATKELLTRFLKIVDLKDPSSGQVLADDIFVPDGQLIASNGAFNGQAGMQITTHPIDLTSEKIEKIQRLLLTCSRVQRFPSVARLPGML